MKMRIIPCVSLSATLAMCSLAACTATDAGTDAGTGSGSGSGSGSGGGSGSSKGCATGSLLAGDPLYDGDIGGANVAGQALLADPPIRNEAIAVVGNRLFMETEFEIWSADLSAATPTLSRFLGTDPSDTIDAGKACRDTRLLVVRDMTATADGKLVVVDFVGGALLEITDPGGANCQSHYVAGTHETTEDPGQDYPLAQGDQDGPGAQALFGGVGGGGGIHKVAVDATGNIYLFDNGTAKFKKVATDAARTVSTIGQTSGGDTVMGIAFVNGKLYATGVDGTNDFLLEIDPAKFDAAHPKASVKDVFRSREHFPDVEAGHQAVIAQLMADGQNLIVSAQSGYIWRLATDGTILATLAGTGAHLDYRDLPNPDFNPKVPHPGNKWYLNYSVSNPEGGPWLASGNGKLFWSGGFGTGKHILQFDSCK
jgi:hypothetical protein